MTHRSSTPRRSACCRGCRPAPSRARTWNWSSATCAPVRRAGPPERELARVRQASGTRRLDGPTVAGAYVLAVRGTTPTRALAHLRAEPAVTLAQPLGAIQHDAGVP